MKIKSCPFCGGDDLNVGYGTKDREGTPVYIFCENCGAIGPWIYDRRNLENVEYVSEISGWNKRAGH